MNPKPPGIPPIVEKILDSIERDSIIGDLNEEYLEFVLPERGPRSAWFWFWMHLTKTIAVGGWLKFRAGSGNGVQPTKTLGDRMNTLFNDLKFGLRMVWKAPGISVTAIVAIALGVGITTHTFSIVYGAAIRGLPYEGAERLMHLERAQLSEGITSMGVPIHDYLDWREQQDAFTDLAAFYENTVNIADLDGQPERFFGGFVSWNTFEQVGVTPVLGRLFREDDDRPDAPLTMVVGYNVWQDRYAGSPDVLGKTVRANGLTATIIGVMPPKFRFPFYQDLWMPLRIDAGQLTRGEGTYLEVIGRLREGVTRGEAMVQMSAIAERLALAYPEANEGITPIIQPYVDEYMPQQIVQIMYLMLGAVFGVLLIACANVTNLFMARAAVRGKEIAVRTALGAKRLTIIRQLLVESSVLAVIGGVLGVALSYVGIGLFNAWVADIQKPYWIDMRLDTTVLLFALAVTMIAGLISGTIPALRASGAGVNEILKDENRGSSGFRVGRFSAALVIGEIAVSCALLVGAGLMIKSVAKLRSFDMGFETENVFTARIGLFETDYPELEDRHSFFTQLVPLLEAIPGALSVALTSNLPGTDLNTSRFSVEGAVYATDRDYPITNYTVTTPGLFEVFGTGLLEGEDFNVAHRESGLSVVIVNQSFARRFFPDGSALGKRMKFGASESTGSWRSVVGVVPDLWVSGGVGGLSLSEVPNEQVYIPMDQANVSFASLAVRTAGEPGAIAPDVRQAVSSLDPNLPIYDALPMTAVLEQNTWSFGVFGSLFTMFGFVALVMAAVGLYGVMAFSVSSRKQEMGIRMAMGAVGKDIVRLILRKGLQQLGIGLFIGLGLGFAMSRAMRQVLFGVSPGDAFVYLAIVITLLGTGTLACLIPAQRATRVNVVDALKPE